MSRARRERQARAAVARWEGFTGHQAENYTEVQVPTVEVALEVGMVNRIVPPSEANALAQAQARKLAAKPMSSLIETKRLMKGSRQQEVLLKRISEEGASFGRMLGEPAAREAMTAFMEKRHPDFSKL